MDSLVDLDEQEQTALFCLCSHLLDLDWPVTTESRERLVLLWLEWRDRWGERVTRVPAVEVTALLEPEQHQALDRAGRPPNIDGHLLKAIETLRLSPCRRATVDFLVEIAAQNGVSQREADFIDHVRARLGGAVQRGAYR